MLEIVASMWLLHEKELLVGERRTSMEERRKNLSSRKLLIKYWRPKIGDKRFLGQDFLHTYGKRWRAIPPASPGPPKTKECYTKLYNLYIGCLLIMSSIDFNDSYNPAALFQHIPWRNATIWLPSL